MDGSVKPLELNTTFDSYDELKESVAHYQRTNFVQLHGPLQEIFISIDSKLKHRIPL
jgi:hypothetical protein